MGEVERGANMEHDRGESCTSGKAEVVSTEVTGRRNSGQEGEHEAKHEEEGKEVCEIGGGNGNITGGDSGRMEGKRGSWLGCPNKIPVRMGRLGRNAQSQIFLTSRDG